MISVLCSMFAYLFAGKKEDTNLDVEQTMFLFFPVQFFRVYRSSNENVEKHRAFYQFAENWQEKKYTN